MAIDFTAPVNANTSTNKSTGSKTQVDYQSFLKLLMAQMKNQDPTKPMESTEYVAQLATFSQVEQSVQMNCVSTRSCRARPSPRQTPSSARP